MSFAALIEFDNRGEAIRSTVSNIPNLTVRINGTFIIKKYGSCFMKCIFFVVSSIDFSKYKSYSSCLDAGWEWCSIQHKCGGFANKQCPPGDDFVVGHNGEKREKP